MSEGRIESGGRGSSRYDNDRSTGRTRSTSTPKSPSTIPVGGGGEGGTSNEETRISPREHKDSNGKSYWEKMQFSNVVNPSGSRPVRIDVDRDGGVFLDHGELSELLQSGKIDNVITNVQNAVDTTKHTITDHCRQDPDYYKWEPKKP